MNVYITFDRYERDEWYSVYHIETNMMRAIKHFKTVDLIDFLSYGPDDCHSFQLMKLVMPKKEYKRLCWLVDNEGSLSQEDKDELRDLLISIYDESIYDAEVLLFTDGCSDNCELIDFYIDTYGIEMEDGEDKYDRHSRVANKIYNDEDLYLEVLKKYIAVYY